MPVPKTSSSSAAVQCMIGRSALELKETVFLVGLSRLTTEKEDRIFYSILVTRWWAKQSIALVKAAMV